MPNTSEISWSITEDLRGYSGERSRRWQVDLTVLGYMVVATLTIAHGDAWEWKLFIFMILPVLLYLGYEFWRLIRRRLYTLSYTISTDGITETRGGKRRLYAWDALGATYYHQKDAPFVPPYATEDWREEKYKDRKVIYLRRIKTIFPSALYLHVPLEKVDTVLACLQAHGRQVYQMKAETRGQYRARMVFVTVVFIFMLFCFYMAAKYQFEIIP